MSDKNGSILPNFPDDKTLTQFSQLSNPYLQKIKLKIKR